MRRSDIETISFLDETHAALLAPIRDATHDLEFPPAGVDLNGYLADALGSLMRRQLDVAVEAQRLPGISEPDTFDGLQQAMQRQAVRDIGYNRGLTAVLQLTSIVTGEAAVTENEILHAQGLALGEEIIMRRARQVAGARLLAAAVVVSHDSPAGAPEPTWDQAIAIHHARPNRKPPVTIAETEVTELDRLIGISYKKATAIPLDQVPFKPSRNRFVTGIRFGRVLRKTLKNLSADNEIGAVWQQLELADNLLGGPNFTEPEVKEAVRITDRLRSYMLSAAAQDQAFAEDPRLHYFLYIRNQLAGHDLRGERAVYQRDISKTVNRLKRMPPQRHVEPAATEQPPIEL